MDLTPAEWAYVEERSERFTGRDWIFRGIRSFLAGPAGVLLVCGPPGSGKTAVAGRLIMSSAGRIPATGVVAGTIDATIVCRAGRVDVLDVSRRLASQLSALPEFQRQVEALAHPEVGITDVHVTAASVQAGAVVSGVHVALDRLGPERAFSAGVAAPLSRMAGAGVRPPVVLVDALDEAFVTPAARELPRLLGELVGVRLVATTRDDKRVTAQLGEHVESLHLLKDAPPDTDDVQAYVLSELGGRLPPEAAHILAGRIAHDAAGNFLYAFHVVRALVKRDALRDLDARGASEVPLPRDGLPGIYRDFLRRELASDETAWSERVRPVLAPLAVAFGDGLTTSQLALIGSRLAGRHITRSHAGDVTRAATQFLDGPQPDGPFRPYHQSFAEFLTSAEQNPDWRVDEEETHEAIVATLLAQLPKDQGTGRADWVAADAYTHAHLAAHAASGQVLDPLLLDSGYLLEASPASLISVLGEARSGEARRAAACYRRVAHRIADPSEPSKASYLRLAALQISAEELKATMHSTARAAGWWPLWASWRRPTPSRVVGQLGSPARSLAVLETDAGPLALAGGAFGLEVWDPGSGQRLCARAEAPIACLAATVAAERPLALAGHPDGTVSVYALPSGDIVARDGGTNSTAVTAAVALPNSTLVATGWLDGALALWRMPDLELVELQPHAHTRVCGLAAAELHGPPVLISAGDTIATDGRYDSNVSPLRVWTSPLELSAEVARGNGLVQTVGTASTSPGCLIFMPGPGRTDVEWLRDNALRPLDPLPIYMTHCLPLGRGPELNVLIVSYSAVTPVSVSSDADDVRLSVGAPVAVESGEWCGPMDIHGEQVVLSASDTLRVWEVEDLLEISTSSRDAATDEDSHRIAALAACGDVLAALDASGVVHRWRWREGLQLEALDEPAAPARAIADCVLDGRPHCAVALGDGTLQAYDVVTAERWPAVVRTGSEIIRMAVGSWRGAPIAATAVQLGTRRASFTERMEPFYGLRLWDLAKGDEIVTQGPTTFLPPGMEMLSWKLTLHGSQDRDLEVLAACENGDGLCFATGHSRELAIWDVESLESVMEESRAFGINALSSQGGLLAVAESRGELQLYSLEPPHRRRLLGEHSGVTAVQFASWHGEPALIAGDGDGWLRFWSLDGGQIAAIDIDCRVTALASIADEHVAVGTSSGVVVLKSWAGTGATLPRAV